MLRIPKLQFLKTSNVHAVYASVLFELVCLSNEFTDFDIYHLFTR